MQAITPSLLIALDALGCGFKSAGKALPASIEHLAFCLTADGMIITTILAEVVTETLCVKYLDGAKRASAAAFGSVKAGFVDDGGKDGLTGMHAAVCGALLRSVRSVGS